MMSPGRLSVGRWRCSAENASISKPSGNWGFVAVEGSTSLKLLTMSAEQLVISTHHCDSTVLDTSVSPVPLVGLGTLHSTTTAYRFALSSRSVASASMTYSYEVLRTSCAMLYRILYASALNTSHGRMPAPDGNMPAKKAMWLRCYAC